MVSLQWVSGFESLSDDFSSVWQNNTLLPTLSGQ
jgi:hypothetical protein